MTEMITGVDLIQEQILAAQGEVLRFKQEDIQLKVSASCSGLLPAESYTAVVAKLGFSTCHAVRFSVCSSSAGISGRK